MLPYSPIFVKGHTENHNIQAAFTFILLLPVKKSGEKTYQLSTSLNLPFFAFNQTLTLIKGFEGLHCALFNPHMLFWVKCVLAFN